MNKITAFLTVMVVTLSFMLGASVQSKAQTQAAAKNFPGVIPFITGTDRLGFFDQTTGRVYMYASNFHDCVFEGQVEQLGKPIAPLLQIDTQSP